MDRNAQRRIHKLKSASQAEILRSHQRDDDFVKQIREKLVDLLQTFGGQKNFLRFVQSDVPFKLIYFVFTSGMGNQTLGEEYTGIVQADLVARKVPSLLARTLAAILEYLGETALIDILKKLRLVVNNPHSELTPTAVAVLNSSIIGLCNLIPIIIYLHKGLFYMFGQYYSLGKRISGIDYAKVYGHRPTDSVSWGFRLLGIATLIQCILKIMQGSTNDDYNESNIVMDEKNVKRTCQLCLTRIPTTTTPCGHLFCWSCLSDWLQNKPQCPFCRERVLPSRIVHVMNL